MLSLGSTSDGRSQKKRSEHMLLEQAPLATSLKYPWQEALLDALKEDKPERWPGKIADEKEPFPHG